MSDLDPVLAWVRFFLSSVFLVFPDVDFVVRTAVSVRQPTDTATRVYQIDMRTWDNDTYVSQQLSRQYQSGHSHRPQYYE